MKIGIFGTFDVENYGDLLFPIIAERELGARIKNAEVIPFSYSDKRPGSWPYAVTAISDLAEQISSLDGIIVGGGHLIRFDKTVAPGYRPRNLKLHHPTSYWLAPALTAAATGLPVVWNAPSASPGTPKWARPILRLALDLSDYVAVRDRATLEELRRVEFSGECAVVPDSVFGIANLCTVERAEEVARPLLDQSGIQRDFIIIHAQGYTLPIAKALASRDDILARYDILILPIGPVLGDDVAPFADILPSAKFLPRWPTPPEIAALIACSSGSVATSLHLSVTSLCYGLPVLRPIMPDAPKYRFLRSLPQVSFASEATQLPQTFVERLGRRQLSKFVDDSRQGLARHWDEVSSALQRGRRAPTVFINRIQNLWNEIPLAAEEIEVETSQQVNDLSDRLEAAEQACRSAENTNERQEEILQRLVSYFDLKATEIRSNVAEVVPSLESVQRQLLDGCVERLEPSFVRITDQEVQHHAELEEMSARIRTLERGLTERLDHINHRLRKRRLLKKLGSVAARAGRFGRKLALRLPNQQVMPAKAPISLIADAANGAVSDVVQCAEEIRKSNYFDAAFYVAQAGKAAQSDPALHYVLYGEELDLRPSSRFDPSFYRKQNPDVASAGINLLRHYISYGRQEGRRAVSALEYVTVSRKGLSAAKKTVLVLTHQASRTGAPILGWNIIRQLKSKYNVVSVVLRGGDLEGAFAAAADASIGPLGDNISDADANRLAKMLVKKVEPLYAIANSVETRSLVPALAECGVPVVSLVHEFSSYTFPRGTLADLFARSAEIVFPAQIVAKSSIKDYPAVQLARTHVLAQGPSEVPLDEVNDTASPAERLEKDSALEKRLRPHGMEDAFLVVGMGFIHERKGVDMFVSVAASMAANLKSRKVRFVWVGDNFRESAAADFNFFLREQITRSALGEAFEVIDAVDNIDVVYKNADVLFLSSRLDPLPNVSIDALLRGIPVVCFANASGTAEILIENEITSPLVVPYCDVAAATSIMTRLASDEALYASTSAHVQELAQKTFDMSRYTQKLDELGVQAALRFSTYSRDADLLVKRDNFDEKMYLGKAAPTESKATTVRQYLTASRNTDFSRCPPPGVHPRKGLPGFNPFTYASSCSTYKGGNPLVEFIAAGRPSGPWMHPVVRLDHAATQPDNALIKSALHIHLHYPHNVRDLAVALNANSTKCDLLISATSEEIAAEIDQAFRYVQQPIKRLDVVPNHGRDIKPFLDVLASDGASYDVIGHIHGKRSIQFDGAFGNIWRNFLWQNLVGPDVPALDIILNEFSKAPDLGLIFPEDPYFVGWEANHKIATDLAAQMGIAEPLPLSFDFPVGTMFWARTEALSPLLKLPRSSSDFPAEPLPADGTVLHAVERLLPIVTENTGFHFATTHCASVTR